MTRVKICGITRAADAEFAEELGADYLGFIFVKESRRYIAPERVPRTARARRVGVFRGASLDEIRRTADVARLDMIQIHGAPLPVGLPLIHAFTVQDALPDATTDAEFVLFDTGGGVGRAFDWRLLDGYPRTKPFFLAGGIRPENVAAAIAQTRPYAIDVATGVESGPGIKDFLKMKMLFEAIAR